MEFSEAVDYLYGLGNEILAMKLGLETIRCLCLELGSPQDSFPAVHIAGTNGKGSTAAMTEAILRAGGVRTSSRSPSGFVSEANRFRRTRLRGSGDVFVPLVSDWSRAGTCRLRRHSSSR